MAPPADAWAQDIARAEAYEQLLVPGLFTPSTRRAMALAAPRAGERLLDVGCGTGIGARLAEAKLGASGAAFGLDLDAAMLHVARRAGAGVHWLRADARKLPLPDAAFDIVLCLQGLQFVGDREMALLEARRVLEPDGRLVVTTWGPLDTMPGHAAVYAALEDHGIDTASPRRGFGLGIESLQGLARNAGFDAIEVTVEDDDAVFASTAAFVEGVLLGAPYTRRILAGRRRHVREACARDAARRLACFSRPGPVALPTRCNFMVARRSRASVHPELRGSVVRPSAGLA